MWKYRTTNTTGLWLTSAAILTILTLAMGLAMPVLGDKPGSPYPGNEAPSGAHWNLNIIGHPGDYQGDCGQGKRIFVTRTGRTTIVVNASTTFEVTDCNAAQGGGRAAITLPYDDTAEKWLVDVYVRLLGPPTSKVDICSGIDGDLCLIGQFQLTADKPAKFSMKTNKLLHDDYQDIVWTLENKTKFRLLQMRFYLVE